MKKIGILSDTHGVDDPKIERHFANLDEIWHAGDVGDLDTYTRLRSLAPVFRCVAGNIDGAMLRRVCPEVLVFTTENTKVVLTHIGGYPGRYAPGIERLIDSERPDLFVCGHSHILKVMPDPKYGLIHINPGAAGKHGWQTVRTLVRIILDAGKIRDLDVIHLDSPRIG